MTIPPSDRFAVLISSCFLLSSEKVAIYLEIPLSSADDSRSLKRMTDNLKPRSTQVLADFQISKGRFSEVGSSNKRSRYMLFWYCTL